MRSYSLKFTEVIREQTVDLNLDHIETKDKLLNTLTDMLYGADKLKDRGKFLDAVYEREKQASTFMENSIAIPHGKSSAVKCAGIAFGRSKKGIQYNTIFGGGVARLIFLLAIPDQMAADEYIGVLARLSRLLVHEEFRERLYSIDKYDDFIELFYQGESLLV